MKNVKENNSSEATTQEERFTRPQVEKMLKADLKAAISLLDLIHSDNHVLSIVVDIIHERVNSVQPPKQEN